MSKAFVKESNEEEDRPNEPHALPVGFKNYMTPQGHRQLREELRRLLRDERPRVVDVVSWAAGNGDRSENGDYIYGKRRLREIDRRIRFLSKRLEIAQVVEPTQQKNLDQVFFGATVKGHCADRVSGSPVFRTRSAMGQALTFRGAASQGAFTLKPRDNLDR